VFCPIIVGVPKSLLHWHRAFKRVPAWKNNNKPTAGIKPVPITSECLNPDHYTTTMALPESFPFKYLDEPALPLAPVIAAFLEGWPYLSGAKRAHLRLSKVAIIEGSLHQGGLYEGHAGSTIIMPDVLISH
jgi:hypothetical protein